MYLIVDFHGLFVYRQDSRFSICKEGFDSPTGYQIHGVVDKWLKSPDSQSGNRGFKSHRPCQVEMLWQR